MILERYRELARDLWPGSRNATDRDLHLREAVDWIYRAQDATSDRGVSHSYRLGKGWARSYPETTGYIIPTLLNWAHLSGDDEPRQRALEMANWEMAIQDPSGGVPSLADGSLVVFDTGQVLFGLLAAFRETGQDAYRGAGRGPPPGRVQKKGARGGRRLRLLPITQLPWPNRTRAP